MAGRKKLSDEQRIKIRQLNASGMNYAALAAAYNVDYRTISRICNPQKYLKEKEKNRQYNKDNKDSVLRTRKETQRFFQLRLTKSKDSAIVRHLEAKDNVNDYLKTLILKDMSLSDEPPEE